LKFTLSYQHQTDQSDGYSQTAPGYRYDQTLYMDQPGSFQTDLGAFDLSYDAGFATVSSSSSYTSQSAFSQFDLTGLIESLAAYYGNYPRISRRSSTTRPTRRSPRSCASYRRTPDPGIGSRARTSANANRRSIRSSRSWAFASWSEIPGSGQPAGCTTLSASCPYPTFGDVIQYYKGGIRPSLESLSGLELHARSARELQRPCVVQRDLLPLHRQMAGHCGRRVFWQHYDQSLEQTLPMCGPFCSESGTDANGLTADTNEKGFRNQVFKLNTSYEIATHTLIYATWSEGFRRGGVNALPTGNCYYCETAALLTYKPDEAQNTEIGIKGSWGRGSSYTFTLYNIDWKDPQIEAATVTGGFDFVTNGNTARSRGAEAELTMPIADSTKLELGYSYTDAILTSGFERGRVPDLIGYAGDRLPGVSKQQATAALDYSVPIAVDREFHARLDASYRSDFWTALPHSATATDLPGFALLNARAGSAFEGLAHRCVRDQS
jgi:iron complex outermembrane recepter protein